jgi:hypothetical protein
MRQHGPFRLSGRAGGIELDGNVLSSDIDLGIVRTLCVPPGRIALPFRCSAFGCDNHA